MRQVAVVTTGFFDGVHLGHRQVLDRLVSSARERGEEALVVTFWPHPRTVLQQDARDFRLLTSLEEKKALLLGCGVDRVEVLPFTRRFAAMTAGEYLALLRDRFGASLVVMGYDNRIGSDRRTAEELRTASAAGEEGPGGLRSLCSLRPLPQSASSSSSESKLSPEDNSHLAGPSPCPCPGVDTPPDPSSPLRSGVPIPGVLVVDEYSDASINPEHGEVVIPRLDRGISSTRIRQALTEGDIAAANAMLGYGYELYGVVVAGNRLGRTIGFPTANMLLYEPLKLVPGNGVYAVEVEVDGRRFRGMCNIGVRPTVGGTFRTIETHILDGFDEDIYGLPIRLRFLRKIRDERRFPSLEALRDQLCLDRDACFSAES